MTQKELLYVEDAIGHEQNIIKIIDFSLCNIEDDNIIKFFKKQLKEHKNMLNQLIELLGSEANG